VKALELHGCTPARERSLHPVDRGLGSGGNKLSELSV